MTWTARERVEMLMRAEEAAMAVTNKRLEEQWIAHPEDHPKMRGPRSLPTIIRISDVMRAIEYSFSEADCDDGMLHLLAMLHYRKAEIENRNRNTEYKAVPIIGAKAIRAALANDADGILDFWRNEGWAVSLEKRDDIGDFSVL
jgi:hypothetical protein